jgi:SecD/SecF fusion protein
MQGKNLFVAAITALLIGICGYQLLFTWKTTQIENKAQAIAEKTIKASSPEKLFPGNAYAQLLYEDSIKNAQRTVKNNYLDSISNQKVFLGLTYNKVKEKQLNLGLDLKGGMSVVLQVSIRELLYSLSDKSNDAGFTKALEIADKEATTSNQDYISLFIKAFKTTNPNIKLATIFSNRVNGDKVNYNDSDAKVEEFLRTTAKSSIETTYNIINTRVDNFGVSSPNVNLEPTRGRILVELAGVDNPARVRKLLQANAVLEFWETYTAQQLGASMNAANDALKDNLALSKNKDADTTSNNNTSILDDLLTSDSATDKTTVAKNPSDSNAIKAANEAKIKAENPLFIVLNPAVDNQNKFIESPVVGYAKARDTALVNNYLNLADVKNTFPPDVEFMWGAKTVGETGNVYELYAIRKPFGKQDAELTGESVTNSRNDIDQMGKPTVYMTMNNSGSRKWADMTGRNVGKFVAITVDKQVYSAPVVQNKIDGGSTQIQGSFSVEEAGDLAKILNIGKLPVSAKIVEEETVGATLGKEAIRAGLLSMLAAIVIIMLFMIFFYSSAGLIANIALIVNVFLLIGILASFGFTLTLPGIAGIVLTLGMAVDANVIINERIKEELRAGKSLPVAIPEGFKHSLSAILDGNITTLLTALILLFIGLGPVKGFAITLTFGILTTLFTALLVAQAIIAWRMEKGSTIQVQTPFTAGFLQNIHFDFIGKRKITYTISSILILIGIASFMIRGFDMGVDFKGGRQYKVRFEKSVDNDLIKKELDAQFNGGTIVKTVGSSNQIKVTTSYKIKESGKEIDNEIEHKLFTALQPQLKEATDFETFKKYNIMSSMKIEPSISSDMKRSAIWATLLSLVVIFAYVLIRFRTMGYSTGAIAATAHDAFVVVSLFSLLYGILPFSMEVDQAFIAAILTLVGYSVNDTVIIFDRLREYLGDPKLKHQDIKQTMNDAINSTLSRTFNTAMTVLLVSLILFIFGGESIRGFSFALSVGVIVGTYSSIFIASPIMYDVNNWLAKKNKPETVKV